jgi:CarboxypepD_reg-like domain/TonB-dependent Receptor Plug Domain
MFKSLIFVTYFFLPIFAIAQTQLSGYILDHATGETLVGVTIYLPQLQKGVACNSYGYYSITLEKDKKYDIRVSYVGYETITQTLSIPKDTKMDFRLKNSSLDAVTIRATAGDLQHNVTQIPVERLKSIPSLLGQPDLIKALAFVPGVQTGVEGTTGLFIRGGTPDQNLILIDGATVYNASHLFGFQSVFDPNAIKDLKLIKGGFPAQYGGRLSSIVDITMKEGNNQQHKKEFTIGALNSGLMMEGPLQKDKSSYMVSARAAYLGLLLLPTYFGSKEKDDKPFNTMISGDFNLKYNYQFNNKDKIFASVYLGEDYFITQYRFQKTYFRNNLGWGNRTASLRYTHSFSPKLFSNTLLSYNFFQNQELNDQKDIDSGVKISQYKRSLVEDFSVKQQFTWSVNENHIVQAGLEANRHLFRPNSLALINNSKSSLDSFAKATDVTFRPISTGIYIQDEYTPFEGLTVKGGIRLSGFYDKQKNYSFLEPRISITQRLGTTSLNASYAKTSQFVHLLSNNALGLSSDLWVPATEKVPPQTARQWSVGAIQLLKDYGMECSMEAYYKTLQHQIDYAQGISFSDNKNWQDVIEKNGIGRAYGLEWLIKKDAPRFNGWLSYTLSWNKRQFDNIDNGNWYYHKYDRRHNLNLTGIYKINPNWDFSANFIFTTGSRATLPVSFQQEALPVFRFGYHGTSFDDNSLREVYAGRNNQSLPNYHRMDVSFIKSYQTKKHHKNAQWTFGVYNVYGRTNPYTMGIGFFSVRDGAKEEISFPIYSKALLVFVPSIAYSIKL